MVRTIWKPNQNGRSFKNQTPFENLTPWCNHHNTERVWYSSLTVHSSCTFSQIGSNNLKEIMMWVNNLDTCFWHLQNKRPRVLSSDDGTSPEKSTESPRPVSNGYGFAGLPSPDIVQTRLELLRKAFPNKVRQPRKFYFLNWVVTKVSKSLF